MTVPVRRPEDDALDRLDERAAGSGISDEDIATVRSELERLREERDAAARYCMNVHGDMLCDGPQGHDGGCTFTAGWMLARRIEDDLISTSLYAGDTTNELRDARDDRDEGWRQHNRAEIRAEAAEAEVQRLTEGLRKISKRTVNLESFRQLEGEDVQTFAAGMSEAYDDCRAIARALLAASPTDGGGAK